MKQHIRYIAMLLAVVVLASCGEDRQDDIDRLNQQYASIEGRISSLESQVTAVNKQIGNISALAYAVEQGFYITQVKTTSDGYELTLSNGHIIVLQNTPDGTLVPMPAISMTQISGFYYWTLNGILLTDTEGQPLSTTSPAPIVRYDYTLQQWVISIDGGVTFKNVNEFVSVVINDTMLLQVINSYIRQNQTTAISQTVLFQIISTYIQQNYKELFSVDLLNQVVANYITEHYTRIFSYELLEKIFTQYNFEYVKENIKVDELISVIIRFIQDNKEIFVNNDVLYAIISNYIEVNKTTIFSNDLLLEVINNFLENNQNFIDINVLTLVVNNYLDEHQDVVFNTETVRTLLMEYIKKYYVQIFSQNILVQLVETYVTRHAETIFNRTLLEEVINNYIQNNSTTIISHDELVEIINNYLKVNSTTVFNREVLIDVITTYFEKNYSKYISREEVSETINDYISKHKTTIISVDIIRGIVNNYLTTYYHEVFTEEMLRQVIVNYFNEHKEVIVRYAGGGDAVISGVQVYDDLCIVTLAGGKTIELAVYDAMARLSKRVQSIVAMPNENGRFEPSEYSSLYLTYLVSPASMAQIIQDKFYNNELELELIATDGEGNLSYHTAYEPIGSSDGILRIGTMIHSGDNVKAIALHVKETKTGGTDIMTEFTPVGSDHQQPDTPQPMYYTKCPDNNHPHMIDLGLPSGTLWACCDVGASSPTYNGKSFAWGETETKKNYSWSTYKYGSSKEKLTFIGNNISGTKYDASFTIWGDQWRMPNREQFEELIFYCHSEWTEEKYSSIRIFTGQNGGQIIFPTVHSYVNGELVDIHGDYWTSTLNTSQPYYAYQFYFNSKEVKIRDAYRYYSGYVRAVAQK